MSTYQNEFSVDDDQNPKLEFQDFDLSDASKQPVNSNQTAINVASIEQQPKTYSWYEVEYYSKYFNVDNKDVASRSLSIFSPTGKFFDLIGDNPDLYGPFWIATSVIFFMFVMGSVAYSIFKYTHGSANYPDYDYTNLSFAAITVYCYTFILPVCLWGVLRLLGIHLELLKLICLYGYTMGILIPVAAICVIPSSIVTWVIIGVAFAFSSLFMTSNLWPFLANSDMKADRRIVLLILVLALQAGLLLVFKLIFFTYSIPAAEPNGQ